MSSSCFDGQIDSRVAPLRTPLYSLHCEFGARMAPFAGYDMPIHYPLGVLKEHLHTRQAAGLFDVSHMGQISVSAGDITAVARALEALIPIDLLGLAEGRQRYGYFTNENGGIIDDLMISRRIPPGGLLVIDHVPGEAHLHFTVTQAPRGSVVSPGSNVAREVPVLCCGDPVPTVAPAGTA